MANDINKEDPHYKGDYGSIYEVNRKFPTGGVAGDFVVIEGWAHYWNADRGTWCVNAERDSYWDELITNIIEKFKLVRGATYMGVASLDTVPTKVIGAKMYYFATVAGTYKNFDNLVVPQGINVFYSENGSSWVNTTLLEVAQELGVSTNKVVSQKTLNDALAMKFDKESVAQESGEAEDKVMSQKAVSDKLSDLTAQITETVLSRTIEKEASETETSENFGVLINRGETYMFKNVGEGTITLSIYGASTSEILKTFTLSPNQFVYYTQDSVDKTVGIKLVWKDAIRIEVYRTTSKFDRLEAPLKGKKIFTYGDSLVANGGWQDYISSLGANVINSGIGGSTISYRDRKQYVNKDGKYVGDPNEGYTPKEGETLINDTGSGEQRMQYIAKDADYIIVLFGTNDCHQNKAIGAFGDEDNTTFKGAIKTLIKWIRTNRPLTKIVFLTPTIERTDFINNLSLHKIDYVKAILDAEIELNVPVVNLWSRTSWSKENYQNYSSDDIHWNDLGKKEIGKIIAGYLLSEL